MAPEQAREVLGHTSRERLGLLARLHALGIGRDGMFAALLAEHRHVGQPTPDYASSLMSVIDAFLLTAARPSE